MDTKKYQIWIKKNFLKKMNGRSRLFFSQAVNLANDLKQKGVRHQIETSFNSIDNENLLKVIHIFQLQNCKKKQWSVSRFIKSQGLILFLDEINQNFGSKFNLAVFKNLLNEAPGPILKDEKALVIYFDLNVRNQEFEKISLSFKPRKNEHICQIFKEKGLKTILASIKNLAFVSVDLYKNGKVYLKLYELVNCIPYDFLLQIRENRILKIIETICRKIELPHHFFLMRRFEPGRKKLLFGGIYLCYDENKKKLKLEKFLKIESGLYCNLFLKQIYQRAKNFKISFFALKPKRKFEVYFR